MDSQFFMPPFDEEVRPKWTHLRAKSSRRKRDQTWRGWGQCSGDTDGEGNELKEITIICKTNGTIGLGVWR